MPDPNPGERSSPESPAWYRTDQPKGRYDMTDQPQWFVTNPSTLSDVLRSADMARENSGLEQFIHHHAHGQPCVGECAVRRPRHGGILHDFATLAPPQTNPEGTQR